MKRSLIAAMVLALGFNALASFDSGFGLAHGKQEGKQELRYGLKKGEKFPMVLRYALTVKLDKVPEILQGVISEDPVDVKVDGVVEAEVTDVSETGAASVTGTWKRLKAKGHIMVNDLDFDYDAAKKEEGKKPDPAPENDPSLQGFMDMQDTLRKMVREPLKLSVDTLGNISVLEGAKRLGPMELMFRSPNGLMGPLPKEKVGKGDQWKDETKLGIPGAAGQVDLRVRTQNTYDSVEKLDGRDAAVIKSKFAIIQPDGEKEAEAAPDLKVKVKTEGEGEGKTYFLVNEGRAAKASSVLRVKVSATIPNPGGGDDMHIKAQVKIETGHEIGK